MASVFSPFTTTWRPLAGAGAGVAGVGVGVAGVGVAGPGVAGPGVAGAEVPGAETPPEVPRSVVTWVAAGVIAGVSTGFLPLLASSARSCLDFSTYTDLLVLNS
ncbi:hypothetical protein D3C73_1104200 [compost metagenome]